MCLGVPMQIVAIDGLMARCEAKGIEREVSLMLLGHETLAVGDFIVTHLGHAVEKITAEQAAMAWEFYDEILAAEDASEPLVSARHDSQADSGR